MSFAIYLIQAVAFLDLFAVSLIIPLVPAHVRELNGNHIHVGLLGSIYAGFQLISGPLMGSLSDIKGQKLMLIITLLICSIAYTVLGLTSSIYIILFTRAILGIFKQTQMLTRALIPDYEKNEQKQSGIYGKMAAISGAGITFGPVIGGHITEFDTINGFKYIGILVGCCFILNAAIVAFLLPERSQAVRRRTLHIQLPRNPINAVVNSAKESVNELYKVDWPIYWDIFFFKALIGFAMSIYYSNYSLYLKTQYNLSPKYIGYVISFQGIIGAISSYFMGYINSFYNHDKDYSLRNLHVFLILTISIAGLILSMNIYIYTLWLVPLALGNAVGRLVTLEMIINRSHGDHRGTLIGASNSVRSLSGVIAPMIGGFIGEYFSISYIIFASLFSTTIGLIISYQHRNKRLKLD